MCRSLLFLAQSLGVHVPNLYIFMLSCLNYRGSMQWTYGITHSPQIPYGTLHLHPAKPVKVGTAAYNWIGGYRSLNHSQKDRLSVRFLLLCIVLKKNLPID